jgi:lipopolysaccharide/colanic/teichoic acid biosynthesis glycosyltransferase
LALSGRKIQGFQPPPEANGSLFRLIRRLDKYPDNPVNPVVYISMHPGLPRSVDFTLALLGLVTLSPILFLAVIGITITSPGPVFFKQERVGRGGRSFFLTKFRSMTVSNSGSQVTAKGDRRITGIGKVLRKTKIDELPELWNVVKGDLSLVGPRPEVPRYVDLGNPLWKNVLQIRPGITDPVTLKLRNEEELMAQVDDDPEKFYLEVLQPIKLRGYVDYLAKRSWWEDVKVLWKSVMAVVLPRRTPPPTLAEVKMSNFKL